ncbi:MAG TPA: hypothetical protein VD736_10045 [Nitrososphaera sp.]|nr:hypothetical protein [Nitrososphaera sp.]
MSEDRQRLEQTASAIEDLLYMGAIRIGDKQDRALLSPQFSLVVSNVMSNMKIADTGDDVMKLMYFSLLIYMNEHLKVPKSLMMSLGSDLEKNRESMETGGIVATYIAVLTEIWGQNKSQPEK